MKSSPVIAVLLVIAMVFGALVGCGSGASTTQGASAGTAATVEGADATTQKPTVINLTVGAAHGEAATYVSTIKNYFVTEVTRRCLEEANVQINWTEAYAGAVAGAAETLEAIQSGLLDVGPALSCFEPTELYLHGYAYYVPFSTTDCRQATEISKKLFEKAPWLTSVMEEKYNQKVLGSGVNISSDLFTTFPVNSLSDLKGHKIYGISQYLPVIDGIGAVSVQSNVNEAYTSLQTGVYDGCINECSTFANFKINEVCPYWIKAGMGALSGGSMMLTINLNTWNSLPAKVQTIMNEVGANWEEYLLQTVETELAAKSDLLKDSMTITELTQEQKSEWANALPNIPKERAEEADSMGLPGTEVMKTYLELIKESGYEMPRDWLADF